MVKVVGEQIPDAEIPAVEEDINTLEKCGVSVVMVLNDPNASMKFVVQDAGIGHTSARVALESAGWLMQSPHYDNGAICGFKVSKRIKASDVSVWAD